MRATTFDRETLQMEVESLGPWFHNLHLPHGIQTAPHHPYGDFPSFKWQLLSPLLPPRLDGWTALDIGCNAGFYSIELARRGARVVAIDPEPRVLRQAAWAARQFGVADRIHFRQAPVYDLARSEETFDLVWFMGVFYHLRYPLLGLDIVAEKVRRMMVFQTLTMPGDEVCDRVPDTSGTDDIEDREMFLTAGWPLMAFIEQTYMGDPTNWWAPNRSAVQALLRSAGFRITAEPGHEMYICEPDAAKSQGRDVAELHAATGRPAERRAGAA